MDINASGSAATSGLLVDLGLSEPEDPLLRLTSTTDPRYREQSHGGRPTATDAGEKSNSKGEKSGLNMPRAPKDKQSLMPMVQVKRRLFANERASTNTFKLLQHLVNAPFELLRGAMGVKSPNVQGIAGMMGKATPYGYDPFGPGQVWDQ